MNRFSYFFLLFGVLLASKARAADEQVSVDVCIYGGTPAGIAAAVSAGRQGLTVLVIEPSHHLGGLVTGGMSNPDFKTFEAVGGFYLDFMERVVKYYTSKYGAASQQVKDCYRGLWYEPKVAGAIFSEMLSAFPSVRVIKGSSLTGTDLTPNGSRKKLASVRFMSKGGSAYIVRAGTFIDATYEGDLMAAAGVEYTVGREPRQKYGELFAGVKYYDNGKFLIGSTGQGDNKIQCYNFRICMTDQPANRVAIEKPEGYDRDEFGLLLQLLRDGRIRRFEDELVGVNRIPNGKADINDKMYSLVSLRLPGENYEWPEGDAKTREKIFRRHLQYTLSFLWFLQNDPEVPQAVREEASKWGLPKDEFGETGHFPPVLYVREGRRMVGGFVLTENDLQPAHGSIRAPLYKDAIAICDYSMDSHGNDKPSPLHPGITEGVFNYYVTPYQIPYRVMVPEETDGLLVVCAVSASHVAFSSLRMEPTWCALGQAAGVAAAIAQKSRAEVRNVNLDEVAQTLYRERAMTIYISDVPPQSPVFEAAQYWGTRGFFHQLPEFINVAYTGRGQKGGLPGQFILKYPHHEISPDRVLDETLAKQWLTMANGEATAKFTPGMTRGEFLIQLYKNRQRAR